MHQPTPWIIKISFYGLTVSLVFIGWSLFNVSDTFAFDFSYAFGLTIILIGLLHIATKGFLLLKQPIYLVGILLLSILFSALGNYTNEFFSLKQYTNSLIHSCFYFTFFIAFTHLPVNSKVFKQIFYLVLILSFIVSLYGIYQFFGRLYGLPFATLHLTSAKGAHIEAVFLGIPRISSFFSEPSWFAQYLFKATLITILIVTINKEPKNFIKKYKLGYPLLFINILAILLSFSLATIFIALTLISMILILQKKWNLLFLMIFIFICMITVSSYLTQYTEINILDIIGQRITGIFTGEKIQGESLNGRSNEIAAGFDLFMGSPIWGIGHGQSRYFINEIYKLRANGISNYYLILLAEQGILGLLSFCLFTFVLLHDLIGILRKYNEFSQEEIIITRIIFYLIITDLIYLNSISDLYSAKYWFDFAIALSFCINISRIKIAKSNLKINL